MVTKLFIITIPVDHLIRIMEIKILFPQYTGQKIRYIFHAHPQSESKKKNGLTFNRSLRQPVICKRRKLR